MSKVNHWGKILDSEVPTTGVFHANRLEYLYEEIDNSSTINLAWEEHKMNCDEYRENGECNCEFEDDRFLIGFVIGEDNRAYEPDPNAEYSAILNVDRNTIQIVKSKWGIRCALCSPCYPGQADGDTPGEFLAFAIPPEIVGEGYNALVERIFELGKEK